MNTTSWLVRAAAVGAVVALVACGNTVTVNGSGGGVSTTSGSSTSTGPVDACMVPADCAWGEIDHEILSPADCPCLFGCPHIPLSTTTVARRNAQYQQLCKPGVDGQGNPCPVDDCATPGALACQAGKCVAAPAGP